ncbi:MAG TPA: EmrB/QacA family drug resistance transporter [Acetobacteraceae bacterium]|nr:EmrB/QacA family drug resistance transporter [Acetobacteraceae bacterium]
MNPTTRLMVTVCTIMATLMQSVDSTIANVALPYMQGTMSVSQEEINWVLTSYIVAAAIMTAPTGFLAARFGRTRLFVTAVVGFTVASVLCGLARSMDEIVIFRVLQGMCGAALVPLSQSVMFDIHPVEQRGRAMALWTMGVMIGPIFGPILGDWLTEYYSWRWVFYINVPFGIVTAFGLLTFLKETSFGNAVRLDWIGCGALSLAIGAFQTMLDRGETLDWFGSTEIILEACLAGVGFYVFLVQLSLAPKPFLPPKLFSDRNFVVGITLYFTMGLIMYATLALQAPYLQTLMDYPVVTAGIVLASRGAGLMLAALVCGRLIGKISARLLVGIGFTTGAYALHEMTSWTPEVSEWTMIGVGFLQGLSIGFLTIPINIITFATLPPAMRIEAAGVYSLMRNLGSAIGISVTGALLAINTQINHALIASEVDPFNRALQVGAVMRYWNPGSAHGPALLNQQVIPAARSFDSFVSRRAAGILLIWRAAAPPTPRAYQSAHGAAGITRQAEIIAYVDDFKLMLVLAIIVVPLLLLVRPPPPVGKPGWVATHRLMLGWCVASGR